MRVVVTNDDGIDAPGLHALARAAHTRGHEVIVVAPAQDYSGFGAALGPLHVTGEVIFERRHVAALEGLEAVAIDGPPALCALTACLGGFGAPPDVVLSGINAGANLGRAVLHSGTVGAALTAAQLGIPAAAVSLDLGEDWHWDTAADLGADLIELALDAGTGGVYSLNSPNVAAHHLAGVRAAGLAAHGTVQAVMAESAAGTMQLTLPPHIVHEGSDEALLRDGYATLTFVRAVQTCEPGSASLASSAALLEGAAAGASMSVRAG